MTIIGLDALIRKMQAAPAKVQQAGAAVSLRRAQQVADAARASVPRDRGALAVSIRVEPQANGSVLVKAGGTEETARRTEGGFTGDEALLVEYGTKDRAAHPFFRTAVEGNREGFGAEIEREIKAGKD